MNPKEMTIAQLANEIKEVAITINRNEKEDSPSNIYLAELTNELYNRMKPIIQKYI